MTPQSIHQQITKLSNKPGHETVKHLLCNVLTVPGFSAKLRFSAMLGFPAML